MADATIGKSSDDSREDVMLESLELDKSKKHQTGLSGALWLPQDAQRKHPD